MAINLEIHKNIEERLDYFISNRKIPNILFHGPNGSGKRTIVYKFIDKIYNNNRELKQNYVLFVNCAQGKGIKFIREDLKFFAKTNINSQNGNLFKSVILSNADKLTIDAQSALRRCIELFSHTTRFFIIVEDKFKLLKPILSRFSELYIPLPIIDNKSVNLHNYNIENSEINKSILTIKKILVNLTDNTENIYQISEKLYNKGVSGLDIIEYINVTFKNDEYKFKLLTVISKVKNELHNEMIMIIFIINLISNSSLEDLHSILEI
ncbi:replication factor C small subunit [Chrysochromulina ericina virus CeV-01B]|uniref:Replication factor C small subunit n=1 Tax=Chrysochromulina ericina virus CeV-01B TaxID=3070830 RepID=A0A0N7G7K3_9VIRU|nr:replication factor C small subunit [Chrysochromulina ericina virus]ALH23025.1 replication factor C small subunit [Chrysochromulina ericina virus CeV-01B]